MPVSEEEAARLAGWNPDDGEPPYQHTPPPEDDEALGNNGVPPTDAPRIA